MLQEQDAVKQLPRWLKQMTPSCQLPSFLKNYQRTGCFTGLKYLTSNHLKGSSKILGTEHKIYSTLTVEKQDMD